MRTGSSFEVSKKKKKMGKYFGFHSFGDRGYPAMPSGSFRENIRFFLQECAEIEEYEVEGMPIWCTFLVLENRGIVIPLYTIEEDVQRSLSPFCDHCRCVGWSHHFLSSRRYHFVIPVYEEWTNPLTERIFHIHTHLLHGLIHCNGYGHLVCINGIEGGSKLVYGRELMNLWDRICSNLQARKITVEDVSKKHSMDLRLLHGIAYGHPWFGRWGYRFLHGSFGVTEHKYERAIEILSSLQLDKIIHDFSFTEIFTNINRIISCYRDLSETKLMTLQDLLKFMLAVKSRPEMKKISGSRCPIVCTSLRPFATPTSSRKVQNGRCRKFSSIAARCDSRWPVKRLEFTADVIIDALKKKKESCKFDTVMNRQEVRDAARLQVGDTGLIDYVLKSMNNVIIRGHVVRRSVNRLTRKLEYTIQEVNKDTQVQPEKATETIQLSCRMPGNDVYTDIFYMYSNVILDYAESNVVKYAVRTILDGKCFVKEWPFRDEQDDLLRFVCRLLPSLNDGETKLTWEFPNREYVIVPLHATIGDLKSVIQCTMRDTYCVMENFVVTDIEDMEEMSDSELLFGIVESGKDIWVRGYGLDLDTDLRYEGGADNWTVRCKCGAEDDDGERMVSCDICEIWHHTRCCNIDDSQAVPQMFICEACCSSLAPPRADSSMDFSSYGGSILPIMMPLPDAADVGMLY